MCYASSYAVICNAREGKGLGIDILALVDRRKCSTRWWTSDEETLVVRFRTRDAADNACSKLRFNNARVMQYATAVHVIREQAKCIREAVNELENEPSLADCEGW